MTITAEGSVTKADFDAMEARLNTRLEMLAAKIEARFAIVDEQLEGVDERFNTFDEKLRATQDRITVAVAVRGRRSARRRRHAGRCSVLPRRCARVGRRRGARIQ